MKIFYWKNVPLKPLGGREGEENVGGNELNFM